MTYNPFGVFAWYQAKFFLASAALDVNGTGYCRLYCRNDGASDYFYYLDSAGNERKLVYVGGTGSDTNKVMVSATDAVPDYLYTQLAGQGGISVTKADIGAGNEVVNITGGKVMVSASDTTPNYLLDKLAAGTGITVTETNDGGDEDVTIASTIPDLHDKTFVTISAEAALDNERVLTAGNGISVTDGGAGTTVTIAAEWKDDGTGTLVPVTANDNVEVISNTAGNVILGENTGSGNGVVGVVRTATDRTAEKYALYAGNYLVANGRTNLGIFADLTEAAAPEDAPSGKVRIFAKTDGKPYSVDDAGNEYDLTSGGASFTAGMIMMWSGTIATIPAGWVLCDGNNSTPNLTNRFIVCADQDHVSGVAMTSITGSPTQSGGSISYTPAGTNAAENLHVHDISHTHPNGQMAGTGPARVKDAALAATNSGAGSSHNHAFTGTAASIVMPYFALAYIMKT
jgi:hypothetical protein